MTRLPCLAALLVCLGGSSLAAPAAKTDGAGATHSCRGADDRIGCRQGQFERGERRLQAAYAEARAALRKSRTLPDGERAAALATLERTQRSWRAYRRARCEGEVPVSFTGGTGGNEAVLICLLVQAERRTAELDDLAGMD